VNLRATLPIALRALLVNKLRSALTMLGVIIGVGAVIAMVSVGAGAQARVTERIQSLGSNLLIVISGSVTTGGVRLGHGSRLSLTEDDARAIEREIPSVQVAAPSIRGGAQAVFGNLNWSTAVYGATPDYFTARDWSLAAGRFFTAQDAAGTAKVALLGQTVVEKLFGGTDPVGQTIRVRKVPFTVVGVLERKGQTGWGHDQDDVIIVPLASAKTKVLGTSEANPRAVGAISIKVREAETMKETERQVRALLRQRHNLQPGQDDDFSIRNLSDILEAREESSRVLTFLLAAIASVSLLVGGIGIMNIMLVSVTERTREIGLRMAVGARGRDIMVQFLVEALTLSLIGGLIGVALGLSGSYGIAHFAEWPVLILPDSILLAFGFAGAVGIFFGFYPARKAARLNPIEALRYE